MTSNSDFEGKMSESELLFSSCCRAKCNTTVCFRSVVEQSAAKHDVSEVLLSKVQQNIMFLEVLSSKVQQNSDLGGAEEKSAATHRVFRGVAEQSAAKHRVFDHPVTPEQPIRASSASEAGFVDRCSVFESCFLGSVDRCGVFEGQEVTPEARFLGFVDTCSVFEQFW